MVDIKILFKGGKISRISETELKRYCDFFENSYTENKDKLLFLDSRQLLRNCPLSSGSETLKNTKGFLKKREMFNFYERLQDNDS